MENLSMYGDYYPNLLSHFFNYTGNDSDDYPYMYPINYTPIICEEGITLMPQAYEICINVLLPIVSAFGIVGILLTVIVLSQKSMSTSTNSYLISLAMADLCFLITMLPKFLETKLTREQLYVYIVLMTYSHELLQMFLTASVWLTVMLAVERYIAICHPLRAMSICTVVRARIIIVLIFCISLLFRMPAVLQNKVTTLYDECIHKKVLWLEFTDLGKNLLFRHIYNWTDSIVTAILPFSALLILNSCLIREIRRSTNYLRYHLASDSNAQTIITSEELRITMMLISIIVVFFLCQAPYIVLNIVKRLNPDQMFETYSLVTNVTILLLNVRSSWNFIMYCWFSEKFWNTFKRTFCMAQCFLTRAPTWLRNRIVGRQNHSEHGHSNNNPSNSRGNIQLKPMDGHNIEEEPWTYRKSNGVTPMHPMNGLAIHVEACPKQTQKQHCNGDFV